MRHDSEPSTSDNLKGEVGLQGGEAGASQVFKQIAESSTADASRRGERKFRAFSPRRRKRLFDEALRECEESLHGIERLLPELQDEDNQTAHPPADSARLQCAFVAKNFRPVVAAIRELGCENDSAQFALTNARNGIRLLADAADVLGLTAGDPSPIGDSLQAIPSFMFVEFTNLLLKAAWHLGAACAAADRATLHVAASSQGGNTTAKELKGQSSKMEVDVFEEWKRLEARGVPEHERAAKIATRLGIGAPAVRSHLRKDNSPRRKRVDAKGQ